MIRKNIIALSLFFMGCICCYASDDFDIKIYPAQPTSSPLVIDGRLDEPGWINTSVASGFTFFNKPELVDVQTFVRLTYNQDYLYLGIQCDEPLAQKLVPDTYQHDCADLFRGEVLELFFDPQHNHNDYYQIAVNSAGSIYDSHRQDSSWNSGMIVKTSLDKTQWTLEAALPWKTFGLEPQQGIVLGINVCRDRNLENAKQWTNWSQTSGGFHDVERFGHLVLSPTAKDWVALEPSFRKGDRRGSLLIYSKEGLSGKTYLSMTNETLRAVDALINELVVIEKQLSKSDLKEKLNQVLSTSQKKISPLREKIKGASTINAQEWTQMSSDLNQIRRDIDSLLWKARLSGLLEIL